MFSNLKFYLNIGAFVGCFQDQIPRDMSNLLLDFNPNMTVELCAATCFKNGFKYAGLQAGYVEILFKVKVKAITELLP